MIQVDLFVLRIAIFVIIILILGSCTKGPEQTEFPAPIGLWNIGSIYQSDYYLETEGLCSIIGGCWKNRSEDNFIMDSIELIEFYDNFSWRYFGNTARDHQGRICFGGVWVNYEIFHKDWSYPINVYYYEDSTTNSYGGFFSYRGISQIEIWYYTHSDMEAGERTKMTIHCWK